MFLPKGSRARSVAVQGAPITEHRTAKLQNHINSAATFTASYKPNEIEDTDHTPPMPHIPGVAIESPTVSKAASIAFGGENL
jgi:hypothetical protein